MTKHNSFLLQAAAITASAVVLAVFMLTIHYTTPVSSEEKWKEIEIPEGASYSKRHCRIKRKRHYKKLADDDTAWQDNKD